MAGFCQESAHPIRIALLASAFFFCAFSAPVLPAEDIDEESVEETIEEIVVIGSRLRRRDYSSPSPISTIDRDALYASGQGTLESALSQMPQFFPSFDRTANNPGNGRAYVNLRGLGPGRTLVMLNGRRMAPSGIGTAVDLNNLPQALIESVEVVTGGASAVYGSDAVSGVVNFTLREDFDGFGLDASTYATEEGDSTIYDLNLAYGHNFSNGRGNITLYGGYYDREETYADARAFTSVPLSDDIFAGEIVETGSPRVPDGSMWAPAIDWGNGPADTIFDADGNPREFIFPDDLYNFAPANFLQLPLQRYHGGLFLSYDLTDRSELYGEASYSRSEVDLISAPVPAAQFLEVNFDNPVLTPATRQLFTENLRPSGDGTGLGFFVRRFEELGPRINEVASEYTRVLAGIRGDILYDWEFDAWVTYTRNDEDDDFLNDGSLSRWQQGSLVDPATGQCFDPSGGCVPVNMFGAGNLSPEAAEFLRLPRSRNTTSREQMQVSAYVRGRVFDTWAGPVETVLGVEWRRDDGSFEVDPLVDADDSMTAAAFLDPDRSVIGEEDVAEIYAEVLVPLAEDMPFADYLGVEFGGRYSRYENAGSDETYKIGMQWAPIPDLRFRSMFQRSVRAPNLREAFEEQVVFVDSLVFDDPTEDPCSASAQPQESGNVDKCIATGLPADQIGVFEAGVFPASFVSGGNPDLESEMADTLTLGIVVTPEMIPNLQISVDYFEIDLAGEIGSLNAVNACFDVGNVDNLFCDQISRDPVTFNVSEVLEFNINRGALKTSGFDTQVSYAAELPPALAVGNAGASLTADIVWSHLRELRSQETPFSSVVECAGTFGNPCRSRVDGMTWPTDRITTRLRYDSGDLSAYVNWRWIARTDNGVYDFARLIGFPVEDVNSAIPYADEKNYFDVGVAYRIGDHVTAGLTVANVTDTDPPLMAQWVWDKNTDTRMYDIFGRSYTLSVSLLY
jgi:outer membrane receptor protein involved in Fe transport